MTDIETIWKEYHDKLHRFIASRVADASTVDDLLQEVFVKIHQRIGTLEDDARIQSWLYQVTRNAVIDYFRSQRPMEDISEEASIPETSQNTALMELAECIRPMVERLAPSASRGDGAIRVGGTHSKGGLRKAGDLLVGSEIARAEGTGQTQRTDDGLLPYRI